MQINLNDLSDAANNGDFINGLGLYVSQIGENNANEYASKIAWALMLLAQQNQPENNTDEEVGIFVSSQGKRPITRNGVAQVGYLMLVTGYKDNTDGLILDPDSIGSQPESA